MDTSIPLYNIVNYFCDILEMPEGDPPERVQGRWDDVLRLSRDQGIYFYLVSWILKHWPQSVTGEMRDKFQKGLEWNRVRNIILTEEIVELAQMFREEGVTAMFLKGSAGLVRGLYPLECRYLSDIDVLVDDRDIDFCHEKMISAGYVINGLRNKNSHHYPPYINPDRVGGVELHMDPYQFSYLDRKGFSESYLTVVSSEYENEIVLVPSISDHVWIMMRTDLLARVCLPRLRDAIELSLIQDSGYEIDINTLLERSINENIPYMMKGLLYTTDKYLGVNCNPESNGKEVSIINRWENWSNKYRKK